MIRTRLLAACAATLLFASPAMAKTLIEAASPA